jgi:hypothetical protein
MDVVGQRHFPPPPGMDPVPIGLEERWAPGPLWRVGENQASHEIRSPDGPACSKPLSRPTSILCIDVNFSVVVNTVLNDVSNLE